MEEIYLVVQDEPNMSYEQVTIRYVLKDYEDVIRKKTFS